MYKTLHSLRLLLTLCAILLTVQFSALLHGIEHPFHVHDADCEIYFAAERQGHSLPFVGVVVIVSPLIADWHGKPLVYRFFLVFIKAFHARAPPALS